MDDFSLIFRPTKTPKTPAGETLSLFEQFRAFHEANPHVLHNIIRLCLDVRRRNHLHWSINGAFEVLRWSSLRTSDDSFLLNNNHRAFYARLVPLVEPTLTDFFRFREQRFDNDDDLTRIAAEERGRSW